MRSFSTPESKQPTEDVNNSEVKPLLCQTASPIEKIEEGFKELKEMLTSELKQKVLEISPSGFENLIVKLLLKMGYGSPDHNKNAVTAQSRDGGIDGIVRADRFGFDIVYVQAKNGIQIPLLRVLKFKNSREPSA